MSEYTPNQPAEPNGATVPGGPATEVEPEVAGATIAVETADSEPESSTASERTPFLFRHPEEKLVGGVCGGLGDCFGIDPILGRVVWVGLTLGTAGAGLFAYAALWLLLPVGTAGEGERSPAALELNQRNVERAGLLLVVAGSLWLLANLGVLPALLGMFWLLVRLLFWPALLIGTGLLLLNNRKAWRSRFLAVRAQVQGGNRRASSMFSRESAKSGLRRAKASIPLKRSREDRLVFGVCGAIGKAIGLDANLVRLLWVAFAVGSLGTLLLVYVLAGWILPEETPVLAEAYSPEPQDVTVIDGRVG